MDKYHGRMVNTAASLSYAFSEHFGAALAYNFFEIDLGITDDSWRGSTKSRFHGFSILFSGYWQ